MMATPGGASFRLDEYVKQHELPCTVLVTRGYSCGEADEEESLSNGEIITLHSVQQGQVVQAKDHLDRAMTLPVVHCGRKYELLSDDPKLDNVVYETVLDMISDPHMPKKVRVTASVDSGDDSSTIYANDVLEVVTVSGSSRPNFGSDQRCLVVKNQLDETIQLPLNTPGKFTTQLDAKWYSMAEIVTMFEFPIRVHLVSAHPGHRIHGHNKFMLLSTEVETSVLATVNKELIAIPTTADIEVSPHDNEDGLIVDLPRLPSVVVEDSQDSEKSSSGKANSLGASSPLAEPNPFKGTSTESPAFSDTLIGFEDNFNPSPRASLLSLSESDRLKVRTGSVRRFGSVVSLESNDLDETRRPERVFEMYEQLQDRTAECIRLREDSNKLKARCQRIESQSYQTKKKMTEYERAATFWHDRLEQTQTIDDAMLQELDQYCNDTSIPPPVAKKTKKVAVKPQVSASSPQSNITAESLTVEQMVQLLQALNMAQYSSVFKQEQVDGGLLKELDEDSLESDLGMKSALHRKKLLRTINGKGTPLSELLM